MEKELFTTSEVAKLLGISRIAVFRKIKLGKIKAKKIGRNYVIPKNELGEILGSVLTKSLKRQIEKAVDKTVHEYSEALKLLGAE